MSSLTALGSFVYNGYTLDMRGYDVKEEPILQDQVGRTGTKITLTLNCELVSDTPANLAAALNTMELALRVDGNDATITGLAGTTEYQVQALYCTSGGPWIQFEIKDAGVPCMKLIAVKLTAEAVWLENGKPGGGGAPTTVHNAFSAEYTTDTAGLLTYQIEGTMFGVNTPAAFLTGVLPFVKQAYPLPDWTIDSEYKATQDAAQSKLTYRATAKQLSGPLPAADGNHYAVDGTATEKVEIDEQFRQLTTTEYDLLVYGDPTALYSSLRDDAINGGNVALNLVKESMVSETIAKPRLRASFTTLASADATYTSLVNFTQTVTISSADPEYEIKSYPGADPVVVQKPATLQRVTQTGSAISLNVATKEVGPLYTLHLEAPKTSYEQLNETEWRTTWTYVMTPGNEGATADPLPVQSILTEIGRGGYSGSVYTPTSNKSGG